MIPRNQAREGLLRGFSWDSEKTSRLPGFQETPECSPHPVATQDPGSRESAPSQTTRRYFQSNLPKYQSDSLERSRAHTHPESSCHWIPRKASSLFTASSRTNLKFMGYLYCVVSEYGLFIIARSAHYAKAYITMLFLFNWCQYSFVNFTTVQIIPVKKNG